MEGTAVNYPALKARVRKPCNSPTHLIPEEERVPVKPKSNYTTPNLIYRTFKYPLKPTKKQMMALDKVLEDQRQLYNAGLQERIGCYKVTGKGRSYFDQCRGVTEWRGDDLSARSLPSNLQRWTLKRLDLAYQAFFNRIKKGATPGFPRYRGKARWGSFGFSEFSGLRFDGKRIRFRGLPGSLKVHLTCPLEGAIKSCVFHKDYSGKWFVCFQVALPKPTLMAPLNSIGIDMGLTTLATLSNGEKIGNPRHTKKSATKLRLKQRHLSRCKRGSSGRFKAKKEVAKVHEKITNTRTTYLHQVSRKLVNTYDLIALEDLNINSMMKKGTNLNKHISDASWSILKQYLSYKAEEAGKRVVLVDPKNTSQECSGCGYIPVIKKTLRDRVHICGCCGLVLDRDVNAAKNILNRGLLKEAPNRVVVDPGVLNVGSSNTERVPGNTGLGETPNELL